MAIIFVKERKKQKKLIIIFIGIILITLFILWQFYFKAEEPPFRVELMPIKKEIRIDLSILETPFLNQLQSFEEIKPFEDEIGRENPFIPY